MDEKQIIVPERQTVENCFKGRTYSIDFYQREYVWSKSTVEILLNDIFYAFELSYAEFKDAELTQEVFEKYNWYYLNIFITNTIKGETYIVDGQQRLSTLTLIAAKLSHMTDNDGLKPILEDCIFGKDKWKGNIFRLDHNKRHEIMDIILGCSGNLPEGYEFKNKTEKTLWERYQDVSKYIDEKKMDKKMLDTFIHYFLEKLVLVELSITKDDTPMVFEVINDRGEPLKPYEILKGKLLGALDKNDTDKYSGIWDNSIAMLPGIEDDFFVDYIRSCFIFKRNSKIESAVNNSYHRYIFEKNEIGDGLAFRKNDSHQIDNIKFFVGQSLVYYSRLYAKIRSNTVDDAHLDYLINIHDVAGQNAIILSACKINDPEEDEKIKQISFEYDRLCMLLRLNGVYDSNLLQEISYNLNEKIKGKAISDYRTIFNTIISEIILEKRGSNNVSSLLDYHTFSSQGYTSMEKRSLRYFLARVEKFICDGINQEMQDSVVGISTKTGYKTGYHIEHILSHNEENLSYFDTEEEFESCRNQLGGLLLLRGADNISSSNEKYSDKLKTYSAGLVWGHSLCEDFYHVNNNLKTFNNNLQSQCGLFLKPIDVFNKDALKQRNHLLYEIVCLIWDVNN